MTNGETKLWRLLREFRKLYGIHVRKQVPIGPFVADFAIHEARLVIEVDGESHFERDGPDRDRMRDDWFADAGYRAIRLTTGELAENPGGCIEHILREPGVTN